MGQDRDGDAKVGKIADCCSMSRKQSAISFLKQKRSEGVLSYRFEDKSKGKSFAFTCIISLSGKVYKGKGKAPNAQHAKRLAAEDAVTAMFKEALSSLLVKKLGWTYEITKEEDGYLLRVTNDAGHYDFKASTERKVINEALENIIISTIAAAMIKSALIGSGVMVVIKMSSE